MGWSNDAPDQIYAPGSLPFEPGYDVIGIGNQLPPELLAAGIDAALVMYNESWTTPLPTTPTVKFQFIASNGGSIVAGVGYSANPSTTPTATVRITKVIGASPQILSGVPTATTYEEARGILTGANLHYSAELSGGMNEVWKNPAGATIHEMRGVERGMDWWCQDPIDGNRSLRWSSNSQLLYFEGSHKGYNGWVNCALQNGWAATPTPSFNRQSGVQVRRFPDGTVRMRGVARSGIAAAGTYICQLPNSDYWPSKGCLVNLYTANAGQLTFPLVIDSGNGAMTIVGSLASSTEINFDASWSAI